MWELLTELELWLLDLQLGGLELSSIWVIAITVIGIVIACLAFRISIWRTRVDAASQLLSSASFIFPPPVVSLKAVVSGLLMVAAFWYLLR